MNSSPDYIYPLKPTRNPRWLQNAKLKNHHAFLSLLSSLMPSHDRPKFCQSIRGSAFKSLDYLHQLFGHFIVHYTR